MIPAIIYEENGETAHLIAETLIDSANRKTLRCEIQMITSSFQEALRSVENEKGIQIIICGLYGSTDDHLHEGIELPGVALRHNRDNYVLLCVHCPQEMRVILAKCFRVAGVVLPPIVRENLARNFDRIFDDYSLLTEGENMDFLTISEGASIYRIVRNRILYIEARQKRIEIWTERQCIALYETLEGILRKLDGRFFQCHRSYIVNLDSVDHIHFASNIIYLKGGNVVPVSRSMRDALKTKFHKEHVV